MTRLFVCNWGLIAVATAGLFAAPNAPQAAAQCCGAAPTAYTQTVAYAPAVAYSPVVAQPVAVVRTGWYPGRWFDQMRLRRWSNSTVVAPTYAAAYAPAYTTAYAPASYTAAYAPASYTAAYTPYVTAYAPLQRTVVQASYAPVTVGYAPTTVYSPAELSPVCGCVAEAPCSSCASAATVVDQAGYVQPSSGCSSCGDSSGTPIYTTPSGSSGTGSEIPGTGQPALPPDYAEPTQTNYGAAGTKAKDASSPNGDEAAPPASDAAKDPGPEAEADETEATFQAPKLISPDRTANRPTVGVHHAVYRQPVRTTAASASTASATRTQAEIDAQGWHSAPRSR